MSDWVTHTPDGLTLHISREEDSWALTCEDGDEARSEVLVALIEAIRGSSVVGHSRHRVDGAWVRAQADRIERDLHSMADQGRNA